MTQRIRVAGLVRRGDEILLIQQENRHGVRQWSIPGGRLEPTDLDMFRGAEREVWEETGLQVQAGQLRFISESLGPDLFAVTLVIECHLIEEEFSENIHLDNTMEDDNIHGVAWWSITQIKESEEPISRTLRNPEFWNALELSEGVVYLGRHDDPSR
ncbi:MAG: NUDIX domain-containing protein [Saprospiraceae bacterium]